MKKLILLYLMLAASALAQTPVGTTLVTATVTDQHGMPYAGGTFSAKLASPAGILLNPATGTLNSAGTFSVSLKPDTWIFTICAGDNITCFTTTQTISGTSQSLTSAFSALAVPYYTNTLRAPLIGAPGITFADGTNQTTATIGAGSPVNSVNGQTGTVTISTITGNAGTATALATAPTRCPPGQATTGINVSGASQECFTPASGTGNGDASTNTATSVDSEIAIFSSTSGKVFKRATTTGLLKGTAGVLSAAVPGTDYISPTGIETLTNKTLSSPFISIFTNATHSHLDAAGGGLLTEAAITSLVADLAAKQATSGKGIANGYAGLDSTGHVPIAQIPSGIIGTLQYQGVWNATTNSPTITSGVGTTGFFYLVQTAGSTTIDGHSTWAVGDMVIYNGATWNFVDNTDLVSSVAGRTGAISLTEADIASLTADLAAKGVLTNPLSQFAATTSLQLKNTLSDETGSGVAVFATSPTLVTPILGTPTSVSLANATGLPVGTGISGLGTGVGTLLGTPSSANLAAAITDETGSGASVFANSPTLVTPNIGAATATSVATSGINGGLDGLEGTGGALTAAAGHDLLYPDSTTHQWMMNNNNGGAVAIPTLLSTVQGAPTSTNASAQLLSSPYLLDAAQFSGADIVVKINTAIAALSGSKGTVDARAIRTNLTTSTTLACGANQHLYLPDGLTITSSANPAVTVNEGCKIDWPGGLLQVTTSGAIGVAASSTAASLTNIVLDGFNITASNSDTGTGIDITALTQSTFRNMKISSFHDLIGNTGSCNTVGCYYNLFERIKLTCAASRGNAFHFNLSANEQNVQTVDIHGCLNGVLIGGATSGVMVTNQIVNGIHLRGLSQEGQAGIAKPGAISGATVTAGAATLFYCATWKTEGGETECSTEQSIGSATDGTLVLPAPPSAPAGAVGWIPYVGTATGKLTRQATQTVCAATVQYDSQAATDLQCAPTATWTQSGVTTITGLPAPTRNQSGAGLNCIYCSAVDWVGGRFEPGSAVVNANLLAKTFRAATAISGPATIQGVGQSNVSPAPFADNAGTITTGGANQRNTKTYGYNPIASNNLLPNASFELWTDSTHAVGWQSWSGTNVDTATCNTPTTCASRNSTVLNQGTYSVEIGDTGAAAATKGIVTTESLVAKSGMTYTLVYDVTGPSDATTPQYKPAIVFYDSAGTKITGVSTNFENNITGLSGLWTVGGAFDVGTTTGWTFSSGCNCWTTSAITVAIPGTLERRFHTFSLPIGGKFGTQTIARMRVGFLRANSATTGANGILQLDDVGLYEGPANVEWGSIDGMATGLNPKQVAPLRDSTNGAGPVLQITETTVGALGTCNATTAGTFKAVSDAAATPVYNATVAAGGAVHIPVYCNGTNWTNH